MNSSPFLPGTKIQFAWDSTSLGWLKTCPRLYQYHMIEGWIPTEERLHLRFGIIYHSALELYDRHRAEGASHDDAIVEALKFTMEETWIRTEDDPAGHPWQTNHNLKTRETLIRSVVWYLDHFVDDPAKTIILDNGKPAVELSFRMELDWGPFISHRTELKAGQLLEKQPYVLCGHIDRLVSWNEGTYAMDRKTTGTTPGPYYFAQYEPDNQMTLYTLASRVIYKTPVRGVIIDAMQIAVGFSRPVRGLTYRTEAQLEEWLVDLKHWLRQAEGYATEGYWPQNDKSCNLYGGCTFRSICSKSPDVREKFLESNFVWSKWNPLEVR